MGRVFLVMGLVGALMVSVSPRMKRKGVTQKADRRKVINPYENDDYSAKGLLMERV